MRAFLYFLMIMAASAILTYVLAEYIKKPSPHDVKFTNSTNPFTEFVVRAY